MTSRRANALPRAPSHLSAESKTWWRSAVRAYHLEDHHLKLLRLACEAWDRANAARLAIKREGMIYTDRFGAPRKHPAVGIEEQARLAFARLVRELDLEGEPHPGYRR